MVGAPDASSMVASYSLLANRKRNLKVSQEKLVSSKKPLPAPQQKILNDIAIQLEKENLAVSRLSCPECKRNFTIITINDVEVDCCIYCKSYWFDPGELMLITETSSDIPDQHLRHRNSRCTCPVCQVTMNEHVYMNPGNLLVDRCPNGHGVYLESGELKRAWELIFG